MLDEENSELRKPDQYIHAENELIRYRRAENH